MSTKRRTIVIGLDAADQHLLRDWADRGDLPAFARLFAESTWGLTHPPPGQYAGAIWPSLFTGVSPARHGRYFHTQFDRQNYAYRTFLPSDLKHPPFWNAVSRAGKRIVVIDVPKAPLDTALNGVQIFDWGTHDPEYDYVRMSPPYAERAVRARFDRGEGVICDRYSGDPAALKQTLLERIKRKARMIDHFLTTEDWDLFLAVFADSHCAGHQFWHLHDRKHPRFDAKTFGALGDPLKDVYRSLDRALDGILDRIRQDSHTSLIVFSSHGMGPHFDATFMLNDIVARLQGEGVRSGGAKRALRSLWRSLPGHWRARVRAPVIRASAADKLKFRTDHPFFAVKTNDNCGGIRLNVVGREARGQIRDGAEYDRWCTRIRQDLMEIVNLDTGEPIVREVLRTRDLFSGPERDALPDLNVVWNRKHPIRRVCSPKIGTLTLSFSGHRTGDHRAAGVIFVKSSDVRPGPLAGPISIMDIAPTCAALVGVSGVDCDGSVIPGVCAESGQRTARSQ